MSTRKNQEARAVAESKLTVLVDSAPGALAVEKAQSEAGQHVHIRVLDRCSRDAANAEKLLVFSAASKLDRVAECVSIANKAHRLKVLFVHNDVGENWLPFFVDRSGMRALRNMLVHSDLELPARVLNAWAIGGQDDFIADATVVNNQLVVRSCALEELSISFDAFPALRKIPESARKGFVFEADGLLLSWTDFDVHLDLDDIRFVNDPKRQQAARVASVGDARAIGVALRQLREEAGLKQSEVNGMSERQVRRVESGDRLTVDMLDAFAVALAVDPDLLLERLGDLANDIDGFKSGDPTPSQLAPEHKIRAIRPSEPHVLAYTPLSGGKRRLAPRTVGEDLQLAAHSTERITVRSWDLALDEHSSIHGTLEHDIRGDELIFTIHEVKELKSQFASVALVAWTTTLNEPIISDPFIPSVGGRIRVAKDRGVVPRDISKLELRVVQ